MWATSTCAGGKSSTPLYLFFRPDPTNPTTGYLGSSNLTFAGLAQQGELNIDVLDHDAAHKLARWFEDRWNDRWCVDISVELAHIIDESWAREALVPPYHIYLKMAYHLSQEARAGLSEFRIPRDFGHKLFEFQEEAVKIAARHLNKRDGVLIGDSDYTDDWRELMRLYLVRRTRSFIQDIYAQTDHDSGRKFLTFEDGTRSYEVTGHISRLAGVTGDSPDPTSIAWRFSLVSNQKRDWVSPEDELRVIVATDVLSEGQNLQDCFVVVNYDLPWAIIRLIQRVGRVDRIGQQAEEILCYSFLPAEGVERIIIHLRARVRQRLHENEEVVGTDEAFFEDDRNDQTVLDLYHEKAGILDGDADTEVDLASYAYQIWKNAVALDPTLQKTIPELPPVVYSARAHQATQKEPAGVLVYLRTAEDNDALAWIDRNGNRITESQFVILKAAECSPDTPPMPRDEQHHELVQKGVEIIVNEERSVGGGLGRRSGARFRTYERLKRYAEGVKGQLFDSQPLHRAIEDIYRYPLRQSAIDTLNRQLRSGISDDVLGELVIALREEDRLCIVHEEERTQEPRIICSMGLKAAVQKV